MNDDIRLSTSFFSSRKTKKLKRKVGYDGIVALLTLWTRVAIEKPCGTLQGWDDEDIAIEADYDGDAGEFVSLLCEIGFLDKDSEGTYSLHNWTKRQGWVAKSKERAKRGRLSRMAKTHRDIYQKLIDEGYTGISKEQYERLTAVKTPVDERLSNAQAVVKQSITPAPAPSPSPSPVPSPSPKERVNACEVDGSTQRSKKIKNEYLNFSDTFYQYLSRSGKGKKKYTKKEIVSGADTIRLLVEVDSYDLDTEIIPSLRWAIQHHFWSGRIKSLASLRRKEKGSKDHKFCNMFNQFKSKNIKPPPAKKNTFDHFKDIFKEGSSDQRPVDFNKIEKGDSCCPVGTLGLPLPQ